MNYKLAFLVFHGIESSGAGIGFKIRSQAEACRKNGIPASLSYLSVDANNRYDGRLMDDELIEQFRSRFGIDKRFQWRFSFDTLLMHIVKNGFNLVYIRYTHFANPFFIRFLKKLKQLDVKVLLEIPTYPYDDEYVHSSLVRRLHLLSEQFFRQRFKNYLYRIVTFSDEKFVFNVPTLRISNGIDFDAISMRCALPVSGELRLIAVASMEFWHGYDRLIEGLREYYTGEWRVKVSLRLVGVSDNKESLRYHQLVDRYNLNYCVQFYGIKRGKELDGLVDHSDLAVGCLGVHRKATDIYRSLKNVEYCARGIPFLYAETDPGFEGKPFVIKAPADESPIDIHQLIAFFETQRLSPAEIRSYASEHSWEKQMKKVIDSLNPDLSPSTPAFSLPSGND